MKDLDTALDKKQHVINTASHDRGKLGKYDYPQDRHSCDYHWTEEIWYRESVNVLKANWNSREENWTYESHFKGTVFTRDLEEANSDLMSAFQTCIAAIDSLKAAADSIKQATTSADKQIQAINTQTKSNIDLHALLAEAHRAMTSHLKAMNHEQRACIIGQKCGLEGTEYLEREINQIGFDSNIAATFAIDRKNAHLMDLAITHGVSFDTHLVGEKTLLQLAMATNNQEIKQKALQATPNCMNSLLNALSQADNNTVKAILDHNPQMANSLIFDELTAGHYAVTNNNIELVGYFLTHHQASLHTKNKNGESIFKMALRSSEKPIIKMLVQHIKLDEKCDALVQQDYSELVKADESPVILAVESDIEQNLHGDIIGHTVIDANSAAI